MLIKIGLENDCDGRSIAWVLDFPGCVAYGKDGSESIMRVPQALVAYQSWLGEHSQNSWLADLGDFDVRLVEVLDREKDPAAAGHWFEDDARPLTRMEADHGRQVLAWLRADLLHWVSPLSPKQLENTFEGESRSIRDILLNIADAEFRCLEGMGLAGIKKDELSGDALERMAQVRVRMNEGLTLLVENAFIREVEGELWSGRKMLRQAAWHEKDQLQQILRLLMLL